MYTCRAGIRKGLLNKAKLPISRLGNCFVMMTPGEISENIRPRPQQVDTWGITEPLRVYSSEISRK